MGDRERLSRAAKSKAFDHASGSFLDPEAAAALAAATELGVVLGLAGRIDHHLDY